MSIILGILTLIISVALPTAILYFTDFNLMHFSLFFIIPVGAILVGYICGFGYYKGLFLSNKYVSKAQIIVGVILSVICVLVIEYVCYRLTFVDASGEVIHSFEGDHISNYNIDGYGNLTFFNYLRYIVENTPISFSHRSTELFTVTNPIALWILCLIDYLGVTFGVLCAAFQQRGHEYCHTCNLYKKKIKLFSLPLYEGTECIQKLNICGFGDNAVEEMGAILMEYRSNASLSSDEHYVCEMIYCSSCRTAKLKFSKYIRNSKKKIELDSSFNYTKEIDYECARRFL